MDKITICIIIGVLVLAGGIILVQSVSLSPSTEESIFIGERANLYVLAGCSHCKAQIDLFKENIKYLNVMDCSEEKNREICLSNNINNFPTWIMDENKYSGFKSIKQLKELISKNYLTDIYGNITTIPNSSLGKSCPLKLEV